MLEQSRCSIGCPSNYAPCSEPRPENDTAVCVPVCLCVCTHTCPCVLTACPRFSAAGFRLLVHLLLLLSLRLLLLVQERSVWFPRCWGQDPGRCLKRKGTSEVSLASLFCQGGSGVEVGIIGGEAAEGHRGVLLTASLSPPGYLSLSKVVPFSHYAGTLLLLLAGVACLRGRWTGCLVWF